LIIRVAAADFRAGVSGSAGATLAGVPTYAAALPQGLRWELDPGVVLGICVPAVAFAYGVRAARRRGAEVSRMRVRYFAAAVGVLVLALLSPVATLSDRHFSAHMVEHLLLLFGAAPLLAFSAPVTLALQAAPSDVRRRRLLRVLHSAPVRAITHPVVAWVLFAAVMYASHFSALYDAALGNAALHGLEHALYLTAAALFWWPVIRRDPVPGRFPWPARLLYLGLAMPFQSLLGLAIYSSDRPLYPSYLAYASRRQVIDDQHLAGAIMWVVGDLLMLGAIGLVARGWMRHEAREERRVDAGLDAARARARAAGGTV
jgi:putative membrane protein